MIEDPDFTKKIIQAVADHPRFPARMTKMELADQLQVGHDQSEKLTYHLVCALQANLLEGSYEIVRTFQTTDYIINDIEGLTHIGSEYAYHMNGALWAKALTWCKQQGIPLTTKAALKYIMTELGGGGETVG